MNHDPSAARGALYVVSCASSAAERVPEVVMLAQAAGWHVCVITTPQGIQFIEIAQLEQLTGYPVRSEYKRPENPDILPRADAILVFPATFNTLNKWALGITDTLALVPCQVTRPLRHKSLPAAMNSGNLVWEDRFSALFAHSNQHKLRRNPYEKSLCAERFDGD